MSYGLESKVISKWYTALQAQYGCIYKEWLPGIPLLLMECPF